MNANHNERDGCVAGSKQSARLPGQPPFAAEKATFSALLYRPVSLSGAVPAAVRRLPRRSARLCALHERVPRHAGGRAAVRWVRQLPPRRGRREILGRGLEPALLRRHAGADHAGSGADSSGSSSTAARSMQEDCSGSASSSLTPCRAWSPRCLGIHLRPRVRALLAARQGAGAAAAGLPLRPHDALLPRQYRDLGVHRLQHDHLLRGAARRSRRICARPR